MKQILNLLIIVLVLSCIGIASAEQTTYVLSDGSVVNLDPSQFSEAPLKTPGTGTLSVLGDGGNLPVVALIIFTFIILLFFLRNKVSKSTLGVLAVLALIVIIGVQFLAIFQWEQVTLPATCNSIKSDGKALATYCTAECGDLGYAYASATNYQNTSAFDKCSVKIYCSCKKAEGLKDCAEYSTLKSWVTESCSNRTPAQQFGSCSVRAADVNCKLGPTEDGACISSYDCGSSIPTTPKGCNSLVCSTLNLAAKGWCSIKWGSDIKTATLNQIGCSVKQDGTGSILQSCTFTCKVTTKSGGATTPSTPTEETPTTPETPGSTPTPNGTECVTKQDCLDSEPTAVTAECSNGHCFYGDFEINNSKINITDCTKSPCPKGTVCDRNSKKCVLNKTKGLTCGDTFCTGSETATNCPSDCKSESITDQIGKVVNDVLTVLYKGAGGLGLVVLMVFVIVFFGYGIKYTFSHKKDAQSLLGKQGMKKALAILIVVMLFIVLLLFMFMRNLFS